MDDSDSSSSTGQPAGSTKKRIIPYNVIPTGTKGGLRLEKPSNLTNFRPSQRDVCLYTLPANDEFSLYILREVYHDNILHSEAVISSSSSSIHLCVEKYTHNLESHLADMLLYNKFGPQSIQRVQGYLRQVIDGVDALRDNGVYHGNLNLVNSYVNRNPINGAVVVKLANFKHKEGNELVRFQFEDWVAVGDMTTKISDRLQASIPDIEVSLLNGLGAFLKNLPPNMPIHKVKVKALDQVLFWDKSRRTSFYVFGILGAMYNNNFILRVEELDFIPQNWNLDDHDGIVTAMNMGRKVKYQGGRHEFVKLVSGAYTHEAELKDENKLSSDVKVDDVFSKKHPRLCMELVRIVRELGFDV